MTLMKVSGIIYDEGWIGTIKICLNACKKENRKQFLTMYRIFEKNKKELGFIAMVSYKPELSNSKNSLQTEYVFGNVSYRYIIYPRQRESR